jgi:transposase
LQKLLKQYRETRQIAPRARGKGFRAKLTQYSEIVEKLIEEKNDATLKELPTFLEQGIGLELHPSNIYRFLKKRKLTLKKR